MLLDLTSDQEFFRQTTAKFLESQVPIEAVRARRDDPAGFGARYWQRGAELGWASLLVSEELGGGTISGGAVVDLSLIAHEFGRHAAPGPLVPVNVVALALSETRSHPAVLESLMSGECVAAWALAERGTSPVLDGVRLTVTADGDQLVLNGEKRPVEAGGQASQLLVTGRSTAGLTQVLVPVDAPGVTVEPMGSVDLTQRFAAVRFDDVRLPATALVGELGGADELVERQLLVALVAHNAEAVGAMQSGFDMTVAWAFDRYSFGRPLASYQEIKHRFADMLTWLQAGHAVNDAAAVAIDTGASDAADLASAAKAYIGDHSTEALQDCVQLHGGIGVTFEHDIHLYLRRVTVNRALYGTPAEHRQRLAARLAGAAGRDVA